MPRFHLFLFYHEFGKESTQKKSIVATIEAWGSLFCGRNRFAPLANIASIDVVTAIVVIVQKDGTKLALAFRWHEVAKATIRSGVDRFGPEPAVLFCWLFLTAQGLTRTS